MNAPIEELLEEVKQTQGEALRQANLLAKVRAGVEQAQIRRPYAWTTRALIGLASAGGVAALALVLLRPAPLSLAVGSPPRAVHAGAVIEAPAVAPVPMHFGDGTALALAPRARMAVTSIGAHGATLRLDRGRLGVGVVHRPGARWSVHAGAFEVKVTGTEFDVSFDPIAGALTVEMSRGSVLVNGPGMPEGGRPLGAGQTLQAGHDGHFTITSAPAARVIAAAPPAREAPIAAPMVPGPALEPTMPAVAPPAPMHLAPSHAMRAFDHAERGAPLDYGWKELAAANRNKEALLAAEHAGFASLCNRLGATDLVALGDAARLAGSASRAENAYQAARSRFPGTDSADFGIARVAFERGRYHEAATWFQSYVDSYPRGEYAREAAGRLIESWDRAGDADKARGAARAYLQKYPTGGHAALARRLTGS